MLVCKKLVFTLFDVFFVKGLRVMLLRLPRFSMMALMAVYVLIQSGCMPGQSRIYAPSISASSAGQEAMEMYDANKDGKISGAELDKVPALISGLVPLNSSKEKGITAADITARIEKWKESKSGRMAFSCTITRKGKPLAGAEVKFVPEKFLGSKMPVCTGTTSDLGYVSVSEPVEGPDDPKGIPPGYHRREITKAGENIPAKYNTQTIFGIEIAPDRQDTGGLIFDIK